MKRSPDPDFVRGLAFVAAIAVALVSVAAFAGGNAPPPYTSGQVNLATSNSLGGAGRTDGCVVNVSTTTSDILNVGAGTEIRNNCGGAAGLEAELTSTTVFPLIREVVVTNYTALAANGALCFRLGPATDGGSPPGNPDGATALACPNTNTATAGGGTGGCYITQQSQSCTFQIRPLTSGCTSYATCHLPIWGKASAAASGVNVHFSVMW